MQYMNDPSIQMIRKEQRGLDVNDITGNKKTLHGPGSLPPQGPMDRVAPVRPHVMEYDIINPVSGDNRMRMSQYGKNVLGSRQATRNPVTGSPPAGRKMMAKMGEQNINEIWPADELLRGQFDEKKRGLDTKDINLPKANPRMHKLKQQDTQRINMIMASQRQSSQNAGRPYKNASNVFTHLVDDPATRQKAVAKRNSSMIRSNPDDDLLGRMMNVGESYGQPAAQDMAARQFDPVDLAQNGQNAMGSHSSRPPMMPRAVKPDHLNVQAGQMRLFGIDGQQAPTNEEQRKGKRIIHLPQQEGVSIFQ